MFYGISTLVGYFMPDRVYTHTHTRAHRQNNENT